MKKWELKSKIRDLKSDLRDTHAALSRSISNPSQLKAEKEIIAEQRDEISMLLRKQDLKIQRIVEMIDEWKKGCSCATRSEPEKCSECTKALIESIEIVCVRP